MLFNLHKTLFIFTMTAAPSTIHSNASRREQAPASSSVKPQMQSDPAAASASHQKPDATGRYHIGNGVIAPRVTSQVEPEFSERARKKKISGSCLLSLTVDSDGTIRDIKVIRSIADSVEKKLRRDAQTLDENAIKAVKQYHFEPGIYESCPS